jgi:hypothetical protein
VPETTMWGLVVSFMLLAIGSTLKAGDLSHSLKLAYEEIARLRKQLDAAQEEIKNLTPNASETNLVLVEHKPSLTFDETTATWINEASGLRYCAKCKAQEISSPLQNQQYGWKCPVCKTYYGDPMRPSPPAKIWIPD